MSEAIGAPPREIAPREGSPMDRRLWVFLVLAGAVLAGVVVFTSSLPLALIPLAGLGVLLLLFVNPSWGIIFLVFLQTVNRLFSVLVGTLPFFTVNRFLVFWLLLAILVQRYLIRSGLTFFRHPLNPLLLVDGIWLTIGLLMAPSFTYAVRFYPMYIGGLLFFFLIYQLIRTERQLKVVLLGWLILFCNSGLVSLVGYRLTGARIFGVQGPEEFRRVGSIASVEANNFAILLVLSLVAVGVFFWWKGAGTWGRLGLAALAAAFVSLLSRTYSRTGMLLLLVALAAYVLRYWRRIDPSLLIGALLLWPLIPQAVWDRFLTIKEVRGLRLSEDKSIGNRIGLTLMLPRVMADYPLFGVGPGNIAYLTTLPEFRDYVSRTEAGTGFDAHSTYVGILGEEGLVGFAIFVSLLWLVFRDLAVCRRLAAGLERTFLWCTVEAMTLILPLYLLASFTLDVRYRKEFWFLAGIPIIVRRLLEARAKRQEENVPPSTGAA
jgi:hypothetical protein